MRRDERVEALEEFVRKWNRTHKTKIRVIGGFAKKGYSKHDIDILLTKHLPHNIEVKLAQKILKVTGLNRVDIFNPITKAELKALKEGGQSEFGVFGWEALPEQYKPDYIITSYNSRGVPISKGRMAKKDLQRFDYRVRVLAYRDALRKYVLRKVHKKYGCSKLPKKF